MITVIRAVIREVIPFKFLPRVRDICPCIILSGYPINDVWRVGVGQIDVCRTIKMDSWKAQNVVLDKFWNRELVAGSKAEKMSGSIRA